MATWRGTLRLQEKNGRETHITQLRTSSADDSSLLGLPHSLLVSELVSPPADADALATTSCEVVCCEPARAKEWTRLLKHLQSAHKAARVDVAGASLWLRPCRRDQERAECFRDPPLCGGAPVHDSARRKSSTGSGSAALPARAATQAASRYDEGSGGHRKRAREEVLMLHASSISDGACCS